MVKKEELEINKEVIKLKENWQKENLEKTKEVLNEHFERRKQERMFKEMLSPFRPQYTTIELHSGNNWDIDIDNSDFDDDFNKTNKDFLDKLMWDPPIEKKSVFNKIKNVFSGSYWNLRYKLWLIKYITTKE